MKVIIIKSNKPIWVQESDIIDFWKVAQKVLPKEYTQNVNEWISNSTFLGSTIFELFDAYGITIWKWNEIQNDWVLKTNTKLQ
jgi:hypothetical protein